MSDIVTYNLTSRQRRNIQTIKEGGSDHFEVGDEVRVKVRFLGFAKCYQFKAMKFARIKGVVNRLVKDEDSDWYAHVDFSQREISRRPDGMYYGENSAPSSVEVGLKCWPIGMLEKVK